MKPRLTPRWRAYARTEEERPLHRAAQEQAWRERERILSAQARRTVTTGAQAEFALDSVPPGRYRLWADTTVGGARWTWLHPVTVRPGDTLRVALSNANSDEIRSDAEYDQRSPVHLQ